MTAATQSLWYPFSVYAGDPHDSQLVSGGIDFGDRERERVA
ncbi:hypothetical protein [Lentzea nigeriaca]|nr:hypothetical protein [Lentzea nigeriaca]MBM7860515.1 hypothetical protein [Lentzea nigeriaca]